MANIEEKVGNLFESGNQTIVNTINCVGVMGKGIALEYKYRYPEMYVDYQQKCANQYFKPGTLDIWREPDPNGKWILNFPTKVDWKHPSKIEYLKLGLQKFAEIYEDEGITSIAFPPLGATSGGLHWEDDVSPVMYEYLEPLDNLHIEIVLFDPEYPDTLFAKFLSRVAEYSVEDFRIHLGLPQNQASILHEEIHNDSIRTMLGLQQVRGLGGKSIAKIYAYLRNPNEQPQLFSTGDLDAISDTDRIDH